MDITQTKSIKVKVMAISIHHLALISYTNPVVILSLRRHSRAKENGYSTKKCINLFHSLKVLNRKYSDGHMRNMEYTFGFLYLLTLIHCFWFTIRLFAA